MRRNNMFYEPLKKGSATIAIVDGYSVGSCYAPLLNKLGYRCIHVQSSPNVLAFYAAAFSPQIYYKNIVYTGQNLQFILDELKDNDIKYVIVGTESGVELADLLSESLGLLTNGTKRSEARRNKFKMIEALKERKLKTVEHFKSSDLSEILIWANQLAKWPVVIKPLRSSATEKVFFCHSTADITRAFEKIINTKNLFGDENLEVLAEAYLDGTQYLVNMVSVQGQHVLSDLWEMVKKVLPNASVVHDYLRLLPCSFHLKNELVSYTCDVLDALEIQNGPSHNEVFWTKDGSILVEMAARIMGAVNPNQVVQCIGRSQRELALASYLQPERFMDTDKADYNLKKHFWVKFLISNQSGYVKKINCLDEIRSLASFVDMSLNVKSSGFLVKTIDLLTAPGIINLCHEDEDVIRKDYEKIVLLEQEMFEVCK